MNKKKGFTLTEVLAIIVVIAIVSLIATPIYNIVAEKVKKDIFKKSAEELLKATELYHLNNHEGKIDIENTVFLCNGDKCLSDSENQEELNYDGNLGSGKVTVDEDGKVSFDITNNKYCAYKYANNEKIYVIDGTCKEHNINIVHDTILPTIIKKDINTTPYTISVNYETSDDLGIKEVVCTYGDSMDKLDKKGTANEILCLMDNLSSSHEYYYKICAIDIGLNESNPCIEGKTRTKAAIAGTPTIVASWPDTTSIKVDVSGMTIDPSDTISYRYSVNGVVKQDWTTNSSYTYTSLTSGSSNTVLVETKATSGGDLGNIKEATIYTSKTVTDTNSGYSSSSACTSSTKTIAATGVYSSVTLTSPSCSSYTSTTSKSCSTSYSTSGSCAGTRTCSLSGGSGTVSFDYEHESCSEGVSCSTDDDLSCGYCSLISIAGCCADDWSNDGRSCGQGGAYCAMCGSGTSEEAKCCVTSTCYCYDDTDCSTTCYYSGYINVNVTLYKASYSGVVKPSITTY